MLKIIDFLIVCCSLIILNSVNNFTNSFAQTLDNNINLYSLLTMKIIVPEWIENNESTNISNTDTISISQETNITSSGNQYLTRVYINTTDMVLSKIKDVTYKLHPTFNPNVITINTPQNKFAYSFSASAIFTIIADIQFTNGSKKSINSLISPDINYLLPNLPPYFIINDPIIRENKILLNGKVVYSDNISRIQINWGDGNIFNGSFPFSHTYKDPRLYTITLNAFDAKNNLLTSKSIQTSNLFLKNLFKDDSSIYIDTYTNTILKLDEIPSFFVEDQIFLPIIGTFTYSNGSGIFNAKLLIKIQETENSNILKLKYTTNPTDTSGYYTIDLNNLKLTPGKYNLSIQPINVNYSKLIVSRDFTVIPPNLSIEELIAIVGGMIAIGGAIIGGIIKIPNLINNRKQNKKLYHYLKLIENDRENFKITNDNFTKLLKQRKLDILEEFKNGSITLEQYIILDDKIKDLKNKS